MAGEEVAASGPAPTPANWGEPSSRTITWHNPQTAADTRSSRSGLDALRAMMAGEIAPPPMAAALGFTLTGVSDGEAVFTCTPDGSVYNPLGVVHGGLVCTLLDSAIGCAVHTTLPAGTAYTSIDLRVSYLRPVVGGVPLVARGWVVKPGRRVAFAEGDVRDPDGKVVATGSGSCLIMS